MREILSVLLIVSAVGSASAWADETPSQVAAREKHTVILPEQGDQTITATFITADENVFNGMLGQVDFTANVGQDGNCAPLPGGTTQHDGDDICVNGVNLDFSSPGAPNEDLVTVNPGFPELGPVGSGGQDWCGNLRFDFDKDVRAVGCRVFLLNDVTVVLYKRNGSELSRTAFNAQSSYVGIVDDAGFAAVVLETGNCFWSSTGHKGELGGGCNGTEFIKKAKCKVKNGAVKKAIVLVSNATAGQDYTCDLATGQSLTVNAGGAKVKFTFKGGNAPPLGPNTATVCDQSQDFNC